MSLIGSLLALVAIPLKAKSRNRAAERPREVDNLALLAMAEEIKLLQFALDHWRRSGNALMEENERLRDERARLADEVNRYQRRYESPQQAAQGQLQQMQQSYQGLGQLQQIALMNRVYGDCTCVPSRAQAFGIIQTQPLPP
jgi:regulator of replication initiation timing